MEQDVVNDLPIFNTAVQRIGDYLYGTPTDGITVKPKSIIVTGYGFLLDVIFVDWKAFDAKRPFVPTSDFVLHE
jgi:hypothetical protein